jgi:hypothetical protein
MISSKICDRAICIVFYQAPRYFCSLAKKTAQYGHARSWLREYFSVINARASNVGAGGRAFGT